MTCVMRKFLLSDSPHYSANLAALYQRIDSGQSLSPISSGIQVFLPSQCGQVVRQGGANMFGGQILFFVVVYWY